MRSERRTSYRIALPDSIAFLGNGLPDKQAGIKFLNAAGGAAEMNADEWLKGSRSLSTHLHLGTFQPFHADIALLGPAAPAEGEGLVAFRFQEMTANALGTLSAFLCDQHARHSSRLERLFSCWDHTLELDGSRESPTRTTSGNLTILALLRHYLEQEAVPLWFHREAPAAAIRFADVRLAMRDGSWALVAALSDGSAVDFDEAHEHVFYLPGSLAVTWFRTTARKVGALELVIDVPSLMFQSGFRCSRRVAPEWGQHAMVTIEEPHPCVERISRPLLEVGGNGFSIELDPSRDLLSPGQQLHHVRVDLPLGTAEMECVLRMCSLAPEGGQMIAGLEVVGFRSPEDHDRWMRCLVPCVFPETRLGDEQMVAAAWGRLEQSGYLELIEQPERLRLRAPFFDGWTKHAVNSGFRARFFLSYDAGEPIGIAAANLVYPKTCLIHSGGIDKDVQGSGRVLKLASASFLFAHTVAEYSLMLFEAHKPINVALFKRFVDQYITRQDNVFDSCTVYKWHAARAVPPPSMDVDRSLQVVSATGDLLRVLWEHQRSRLSPLELDAYGWSPGDRTMQQFTDNCARDGYERGRRVFFAVSRGEPVAALIAETGSEGMNVFSLLNSCQIVLLEGAEVRKREVLRILLARAVDFYGGVGKGAFLFLGSSGREYETDMRELGFAYVAGGWRWLAARRVIPAYISYLQDLSIVGASRREVGRQKGEGLS